MGLLVAFIGAYMIFILVIYLAIGFCLGKVFEKAGKPLWAGFVPIYNWIVMLEIVGRPSWWVILMLVPMVNIVIGFIVNIDLAKSFGKTTAWGVLLALFSIIMLPIMAFSSDIRYIGPSVPQPSMPSMS
ncbi:MAG: signal peptidase I [Ignavibacteria bacterium]|nr:signal peptidase I [Ignavibacteria bacterium]